MSVDSLDPDLTGNPNPDDHDGIDLWPFGDAVRSTYTDSETP